MIGSVFIQPVLAQDAKPQGSRDGVPLTRDELSMFAMRVITFGAGDYPAGCQVQWGGGYGPGSFVRNCGRVDGKYSAWAWGGNEIRFVGQRGVARRLYFYRRPNGRYYVLDDRGNYAEIASVTRSST